MKTGVLLWFLPILAIWFGLCVTPASAEEPAAAVPPPETEEVVSTEFWTPVRFSIVEEAAWPPADYAVFGMAMDLPEGKTAKIHGFGLGILSDATVFRGLRTGFMHMAKLSQGMLVGGAATSAETSHGFDVTGGVNYTEKYQAGVQIAGWFNLSRGSQDGVRIGGIGNISTYEQNGVQITGLLNQARRFSGFQIAGLINLENEAQGAQLGSVNILGYKNRRPHDASGACQIGAANWVSTLHPLPGDSSEPAVKDWIFQFGVLNYLGGGEGIQFGLVNINPHGFLPFFPILNFNL